MKKTCAVLFSVLCLLLSGCAEKGGGENAVKQNMPPEEPAVSATPAIDYSGMLRISEIAAKNNAVLSDANGQFPDWIEIENTSDEAVPLSGWSFSDKPKKRRQPLPDRVLAEGERAVFFCEAFGLKEDETVSLLDPDGNIQDTFVCEFESLDTAVLVRNEDGSAAATKWPSPGFANDRTGYDAWCSTDVRETPLQINEVMVSNEQHPDERGNCTDWVELKNVSGSTLTLDGYTLSAKAEEPRQWSFPETELAPGALFRVACNELEPAGDSNTGYSLDAVEETLYLFDPEGRLCDYISLHDIPIEGSMGRLPGENGFFFFTDPTPGEENRMGKRRVSDMPLSVTAEGIHDSESTLAVELAAEGDIHYTTDGTVPTADSPKYKEAIRLDGTGVVRAIAVEKDACPSRVATFSYFLNEDHTLPVLSLVVDDWAKFNNMFTIGIRERTVPANLALYGTDADFNRACEMSMKGWTSLSMRKKSMGVSFKGRYGGMLHCDVFGNGISDYDALSLRVGQDFNFSVFRNELVQELCLEASDSLYTQESKYCILYVNGEYYGIYCLKDDITRQFYANHAGVSKESVEGFRAPAALGSDYYNLVVDYGWHSDLTDPENYRILCEGINMDSLIDWFIFEAWCGNTDTQGNLRVYRSTENGNRWEYVLYDLDWAFHYWQGGFRTILDCIGNAGSEMPNMLKNLIQNEDFRDRLLRRFAELLDTVLADDYVLDRIDDYVELLEPEIKRDHERWGLTEQTWIERVQLLKDTIIDNDYGNYMVQDLCKRLGLTEEEIETYFGSRLQTKTP